MVEVGILVQVLVDDGLLLSPHHLLLLLFVPPLRTTSQPANRISTQKEAGAAQARGASHRSALRALYHAMGCTVPCYVYRGVLRATSWVSAQGGMASSRSQIPVIGSIARGDQRLNRSMRGSMEPRIAQFSRRVPRAMEPISGMCEIAGARGHLGLQDVLAGLEALLL